MSYGETKSTRGHVAYVTVTKEHERTHAISSAAYVIFSLNDCNHIFDADIFLKVLGMDSDALASVCCVWWGSSRRSWSEGLCTNTTVIWVVGLAAVD